jgi:hypothetical protein
MLYVALSSLVVAVVLMGLDIAGFRFAHGAGLAANVLLAIGLVLLVAKGALEARHQYQHHQR